MPASTRDLGVVAEPRPDVAHRVDRVADERDVGVAVVGVGVRRSPPTVPAREAGATTAGRVVPAPATTTSRSGSSAGTRCTNFVRSSGRNSCIGST